MALGGTLIKRDAGETLGVPNNLSGSRIVLVVGVEHDDVAYRDDPRLPPPARPLFVRLGGVYARRRVLEVAKHLLRVHCASVVRPEA